MASLRPHFPGWSRSRSTAATKSCTLSGLLALRGVESGVCNLLPVCGHHRRGHRHDGNLSSCPLGAEQLCKGTQPEDDSALLPRPHAPPRARSRVRTERKPIHPAARSGSSSPSHGVMPALKGRGDCPARKVAVGVRSGRSKTLPRVEGAATCTLRGAKRPASFRRAHVLRGAGAAFRASSRDTATVLVPVGVAKTAKIRSRRPLA
jgi:hypothetical protein